MKYRIRLIGVAMLIAFVCVHFLSTPAMASTGFKEIEKLKFKINFEIDTIWNGNPISKDYVDNSLTIINESTEKFCFNEFPVFWEISANYYDINQYDELHYFPAIEFYNEEFDLWESVNFNKLLGSSSEPQPLISDNIICLSNGQSYKFEGLFFMGGLHFTKIGKYRVCLHVYFKAGESTFVFKKTNYHEFYVAS